MVAETVYGVVLNDQAERDALASAFTAPPYGKPPQAPVLYIKPRGTFADDSGRVPVPASAPALILSATLALVIGRDGRPVGGRLALDVSEPHADYYRPAIRERCRDGFLPLGKPGPLPAGAETIVTSINGREAHRWSLDRLVRPPSALLADIGAFMTLGDGDLLLVGLPGDAPRAVVGDRVEVRCQGYPPLIAMLVKEVE